MTTLGWLSWLAPVAGVVAVASGCGPDDTVATGEGTSESSTGRVEPVEPSPWMSGIWSTDYMTLGRMTPEPTGGVGENNYFTPTHYVFDSSGVLSKKRDNDGYPDNDGPRDETFRYRWIAISDVEIRAEPIDDDGLGNLYYRFEIFSGVRGCDALRVTGIDADGTPSPIPWEIYRGSICTFPIAECPDDWDANDKGPPPCDYYYYTWCEEQGDNVPATDPCGEDCYCHLPE